MMCWGLATEKRCYVGCDGGEDGVKQSRRADGLRWGRADGLRWGRADGLRWGGYKSPHSGFTRDFYFHTFLHFRADNILGCESLVLFCGSAGKRAYELGLQELLWGGSGQSGESREGKTRRIQRRKTKAGTWKGQPAVGLSQSQLLQDHLSTEECP